MDDALGPRDAFEPLRVCESRTISGGDPSPMVESSIAAVARRLHAEGWTALRQRRRLVARWSAGGHWARLDVRAETPADCHPADHRVSRELLLEFRCSDRDAATLAAAFQVLRALERLAA